MDEPVKNSNVPSTSSSSSPYSDKSTDHGDESSEENLPIPKSLIGAENYLTLTEGKLCALTKEELSEAIVQCKNLILDSVVCSSERKWLVRRLIELRYQLLIAEEVHGVADGTNTSCEPAESRIILGHHLKTRYQPTSTNKRYCDSCCGTVWNVMQSWYQCVDCRYRCHIKCIDNIIRPCAQLFASEKVSFESNICPEVGLAAQDYKCGECQSQISFTNMWFAPRLCDYTGLYYCTSCHWNNSSVIPARVSRNWDFQLYFVCRATYQMLRYTRHRTLIRVDPRLYGFVKELAEIKRLREELSLMKTYLVRCREAKAEKKLLWKKFGTRAHLLEPSLVFSLNDLLELHSGELLVWIKDLTTTFSNHITKSCVICCGQGYLCEMCEDKEVIFPFYSSVYICPDCSWVYHKTCWHSHQTCYKCERNKKKRQEQDC